MLTHDMNGPYGLQKIIVKLYVGENKMGNYALGKKSDDNSFVVTFVGRSDIDLMQDIINHIENCYTHFKFGYADSIQEAFDKECYIYHDFGENTMLDNRIHPTIPASTNSKCPVCENFKKTLK